jgi:hypothetical protein
MVPMGRSNAALDSDLWPYAFTCLAGPIISNLPLSNFGAAAGVTPNASGASLGYGSSPVLKIFDKQRIK